MKEPIQTDAEDILREPPQLRPDRPKPPEAWKPESIWHAFALEIICVGACCIATLLYLAFTA